jgi:hypothetical protein
MALILSKGIEKIKWRTARFNSNSEFNHGLRGQDGLFWFQMYSLSVLVCVVRGCFEFGITACPAG